MPKKKNKGKKVLVAMSGGVDSSVTAALLVEQGYEVTGAFMKQVSENPVGSLHTVCEWRQDRRDAIRVAAHLGIPFVTLDFVEEYNDLVMEYLFREYEAGRTPNPDVLCNTYIKFGAWLDRARAMGFDYLATGHYARREETEYGIVLGEAKDANKDQTYFLHQLNQEQLTHTLFPIGEYTKPQVRRLAKTYTLPTAERAESMGICFVGEVPMKTFLQQRIAPKPGNIVTTSGETVGTHEGLPFYTIGQRHGFGHGTGREPLYVIAKKKETNELIVGPENDPLLYKREMVISDVHWVNRDMVDVLAKKHRNGQNVKIDLLCDMRLRHRQPLQRVTVHVATDQQNTTATVTFRTPQRAPTPGQFAVFYKNGMCLGGGVIEE